MENKTVEQKKTADMDGWALFGHSYENATVAWRNAYCHGQAIFNTDTNRYEVWTNPSRWN